MQQNGRNSQFSILHSPFIREGVDFFLFGNFFIGFCTLALLYTSYHYAGIPLRIDSLSVFVFSATFFQYNLHRLITTRRHAGDEHPTVLWSRRHPFVLMMLCLISLGVAAVMAFHLSRSVINALVPLALMSLSYEIPIINAHGKRVRLRNVWFFKTIMLVLTWTFTTALLPYLQYDLNVYNTTFVLVFLKRILLILALAIVFDIRDFDHDRAENVRTVPVMLGIIKSRRIVFALFAVIGLVGVVHVLAAPELKAIHMIPVVLFPALSCYVVNQSMKFPTDYFYAFFVDGIMFLELGLLLLTDYFVRMY